VFSTIEAGGSFLHEDREGDPSSKTGESFGCVLVANTGANPSFDKGGGRIINAADYFINYKGVTEVTKLLKIFFVRNEEESVPNLVKRVHYLDAEIIQKEAAVIRKAPLLKKWMGFITGKNNLVQRYQKKL
jgi:hypothetical protein